MSEEYSTSEDFENWLEVYEIMQVLMIFSAKAVGLREVEGVGRVLLALYVGETEEYRMKLYELIVTRYEPNKTCSVSSISLHNLIKHF